MRKLIILSILFLSIFMTGCQEQTLIWEYRINSGNIIKEAVFSPDKKHIAVAVDTSIVFLNTDTGTHEFTLNQKDPNLSINSISFNNDGSLIMASTSTNKINNTNKNRKILIWDIANKKLLSELDLEIGDLYLACNPTNNTLAVGGEHGDILILDINQKTILKNIKNNGKIYDISYGNKGESVVISTGGWNPDIKLINLHDEKIKTFKFNKDAYNDAQISKDGLSLYSACSDDTAQIWDISTLKIKRILTGHKADIWTIKENFFKNQIATGAADGTIRFWDITTGKQINMITIPESSVFSLQFSNDGSKLLSCSSDKYVRLWNVK